MSRVEQLKELQSSLKAKLAEGRSKLSLINEEQTKQFYILRLLSLLGYDSTVEGEIVPEAPVNAGDRIDYLLRVNNEEVAIIECKKLGHVLNNKDIAQLQRYYTDKVKVKLAILTNGDDYLLFTDTQEINVMDKVPYKSFRVSSLTDYSAFDELARENISSIYIPYKENVISQDKAALEQELKQNKKQLDAATKKLAVLESKVYLTEAQKQEQLEMRARALRLENENKSLHNKLNIVKACSLKIQDRAGFKINYGTAFDKQEVPSNIAKDMVDMIPDDLLIPESTFMDICCRYGEFLIAIYNRLMEAPAMIKAFPDSIDRHDHITQNQLYALMPDEKGLREVTKTLFRTSNVSKSNIIAFKNIEEYSKIIKIYTESKWINGAILTESERKIIEKLGDIMYMKFTCVVSNPPYNDDQYIDFVNLGDRMSEQCSVYITPAKWQSKGGKKNEKFRQDIVPRMKEIVYSPDCEDAFNITTWGGVSYFLVDKEKRDKVHVKTQCGNELFEDDGYVNIDDKSKISLLTKAIPIISKVLNENFKGFTAGYQKGLDDYIVIVQNTFSGSGKTLYKSGAFLLSPLTYEKDNGRELKDNEAIIAGYKTEEQCQSCISYMTTRLIRFLMLLSVHGQHIFSSIDMTTWRFVPSPDSFDHIFTDDELYKKYNLTQDEINIIESVIKERKNK